MDDNDTPGYLAAGLMIAAEQQRQANNTAHEMEARGRELARQNDALSDDLQRQAEQSREVEEDYWQLFNLLKQPMQVIASGNAFFAKTYDHAQQEAADVQVRELAFKELAIELGAKVGMSPQAVLSAGLAMRAEVLRNRFPKEHGTNAETVPLLAERATRMLAQWDAERKTVIEAYQKAVATGDLYDLIGAAPDSWNQVYMTALAQAKDGNREAQLNLAFCLLHGKGTRRDVDQAEHWCLAALHAGEARAALQLHYLYCWPGSDKHSDEKAERYLKLAEQQKVQAAAWARKRWDEDKVKKRWAAEEPALLEALRVIKPGYRAPELDLIKGRGYAWEKAVTDLHQCQYGFERGQTINEGSMFSPKKFTHCYLSVTNPTNNCFEMSALCEWDRELLGKRPDGLEGASQFVKANETKRIDMSRMPARAKSTYIAIAVEHSDFASLGRFGNKVSIPNSRRVTFRFVPDMPLII